MDEEFICKILQQP